MSVVVKSSDYFLNFFEHLSKSVCHIIDHHHHHHHEYLKENKQKFTCSVIIKKFQTSFYRSIENLSSSFLKIKIFYKKWRKTNDQHHRQQQCDRSDQSTVDDRKDGPCTLDGGREKFGNVVHRAIDQQDRL